MINDIQKKTFSKIVSAASKKFASDPLMHCFSESEASQKYMFERLEEIMEKYLTKFITHSSQSISFQKSNDDLERSYSSILMRNKSLEEEIENLRAEMLIKEQELCNRFQKDSNRINEQNQYLASQLEIRKEENEILCQRIRALNDQEAESLRKMKSLEEEIDMTKSEIMHHSNTLSNTSELKQIVLEYEQKEQDNEKRMKNIIDELQAKITQLNSELTVTDVGDRASFYKSKFEEEELKHRDTKELLEKEQNRAEEIQFKNEKLSESLTKIKSEMEETNKKLTEERKSKHEFEVRFLNEKEISNDQSIQISSLASDLRRSNDEVR